MKPSLLMTEDSAKLFLCLLGFSISFSASDKNEVYKSKQDQILEVLRHCLD